MTRLIEKCLTFRKGLLNAYQLDQKFKLCEIQSFEVPGLFDIKWHKNYLSLASSCGSLYIYLLSEEKVLKYICQSSKIESMLLSVDWNQHYQLATTDSSGVFRN